MFLRGLVNEMQSPSRYNCALFRLVNEILIARVDKVGGVSNETLVNLAEKVAHTKKV